MIGGTIDEWSKRRYKPHFSGCAPTSRLGTLTEAVIRIRIIITRADCILFNRKKIPRHGTSFHNDTLDTAPSPLLSSFLLPLLILLGSDWPGVVCRRIGNPSENGGEGLKFFGIGSNAGIVASPRREGDA